MDIYLINLDKNCTVNWVVDDSAVNLMLTAIASTLGEIPRHKYHEKENQILIYLSKAQVDLMVANAESLMPNEAAKLFHREIKYLKIAPPDCSGMN